ncbi:hypothetical protein SteCoe_5253 [Stentor coeruleus]|uniref:Uncharacterized protein n=1 Tax=Stentor coeruleus TaxID=5963 RepID=A0A1R2CSV2_9CILI|nr:hypothetical protein SteCoe_5253 [Stentor coeruleus]
MVKSIITVSLFIIAIQGFTLFPNLRSPTNAFLQMSLTEDCISEVKTTLEFTCYEFECIVEPINGFEFSLSYVSESEIDVNAIDTDQSEECEESFDAVVYCDDPCVITGTTVDVFVFQIGESQEAIVAEVKPLSS